MINEAKAVAQRLREIDDSKKPYPSGPVGQMMGCESYRLVGTGFTFQALLDGADTIDALCGEVERLKKQNNTITEAYELEVEESERYADEVERLTKVDSATRSADSAEPFCDTTPNHFCGNRWVHLPGGEQCDKCGGEV